MFSYNQLSQRIGLAYSNGASVSYAPQLNGDVNSITHNFVGSSVTFSYGFNNVHEPISVSQSDSSYTWHPSAAIATSYGTADSVNKYPTVGSNTYAYDGNKNLTGDGTWTYTFDTENHLLTANDTGTSATLVYDPQHRQSQKTVGSTETRYVYSGWQRIADYNGSTNALQTRYIFGTSLDDALLAVSSSGTLTFLHADIVGSIIATSNSSGAVAIKNLYDPFGNISTLGGTSFGFTGQRFDPELNLYYYKQRYYSPTLGRFLQTDPTGYTGEDYNLYSCVQNSPLKYVDPLGLQSCFIGPPTPWGTPVYGSDGTMIGYSDGKGNVISGGEIIGPYNGSGTPGNPQNSPSPNFGVWISWDPNGLAHWVVVAGDLNNPNNQIISSFSGTVYPGESGYIQTVPGNQYQNGLGIFPLIPGVFTPLTEGQAIAAQAYLNSVGPWVSSETAYSLTNNNCQSYATQQYTYITVGVLTGVQLNATTMGFSTLNGGQ